MKTHYCSPLFYIHPNIYLEEHPNSLNIHEVHPYPKRLNYLLPRIMKTLNVPYIHKPHPYAPLYPGRYSDKAYIGEILDLLFNPAYEGLLKMKPLTYKTLINLTEETLYTPTFPDDVHPDDIPLLTEEDFYL